MTMLIAAGLPVKPTSVINGLSTNKRLICKCCIPGKVEVPSDKSLVVVMENSRGNHRRGSFGNCNINHNSPFGHGANNKQAPVNRSLAALG